MVNELLYIGVTISILIGYRHAANSWWFCFCYIIHTDNSFYACKCGIISTVSYMFAHRGDVMQACHAPPAYIVISTVRKKLQEFTFCEGKS